MTADLTETWSIEERRAFQGAIDSLVKRGFPTDIRWRTLFGEQGSRNLQLVEDEQFFPGSFGDLNRLGLVSGSRHEVSGEAWLHDIPFVSGSPSIHIVTDTVDRRVADRVFPWVDEAVLMVERVRQTSCVLRPDVRILDLCTGAGTIATMLACAGALGVDSRLANVRITATDNSERALRWAALNRSMAGLTKESLRLVRGDLGNPLTSVTPFDLVIVNAPMTPTPPFIGDFSHSSAGLDGLAVIRRLLSGDGTPRLRDLVRRGGELYMLAYALGPLSYQPGCLDIEAECHDALGHGRLEVVPHSERMWRIGRQKVFRSPMPLEFMISRLYDLQRRTDVFSRGELSSAELHDKYVDWIASLRVLSRSDQPHTHLHYVLLKWTRSD